jgi:hypothetical protein
MARSALDFGLTEALNNASVPRCAGRGDIDEAGR